MDTLRRIQHRLLGRFPALRPGRFGWGAAQLSAASLASRAIGFVYSAAVMRLAGAEAIGLFRLVWPLYATAFTVATAGVPYAMAKLLAERAAQDEGDESPRRIAVQGLVLLILNSLLMAAVMWWTSPWLVARVGAEPRAAPIIRLLAPALPLACLAAGARAMFESTRRMAIPAASLLAEQVALSIAAIGLVVYLSPRTADAAAVASALAGASVLGEAVGLLALALTVDRLWAEWGHRPASRARLRHVPRPGAGWWPRSILELALPVAAGRILSSVGGSLSTLLLPNRLQAAGFTASQAAAQIGLLRGVAFPLVLMPNMLSLALTTTLVPSISGALARGDRAAARAYSDKALATTILFSLPASAAFVSLPELWTRVLYGEESAAPLLVICGLSAPFIYLGQTLVGVLRGLGRPQVPVQSHLVGLALETALIWVWVARAELAIQGAALAAAAGYAVAYLVNQLDALQHLGTTLRARDFTAPLAAAVAAGLAARVAAAAAASL
ncbi:MAG: MATE family efflux transporter, partial [Bacillota bacterium]